MGIPKSSLQPSGPGSPDSGICSSWGAPSVDTGDEARTSAIFRCQQNDPQVPEHLRQLVALHAGLNYKNTLYQQYKRVRPAIIALRFFRGCVLHLRKHMHRENRRDHARLLGRTMQFNSKLSIEINSVAPRAAASTLFTVLLICCHMGAAYGSV